MKVLHRLQEAPDPKESAKLAKEELMVDPDLKIFRKTQGYRSADVTGKYKMLWRYAVREFSKKINDEEELADVCMEIALFRRSSSVSLRSTAIN